MKQIIPFKLLKFPHNTIFLTLRLSKKFAIFRVKRESHDVDLGTILQSNKK